MFVTHNYGLYQLLVTVSGTFASNSINPLWYFISCDVTATLYQTESTWVPERACFIVKTLKTRQVPVNFKLVKLEDGYFVDLNSIPDCDFALAAAILHFYLLTF